MTYQMPIVIMGGADKKEKIAFTVSYHEKNNKHTLLGYKLVDFRLNGKSFMQNLVDNCTGSQCFSEIYIAGPEYIYKNHVDRPIIDTNQDLGNNIRKALQHVSKKHGKNAQVAIVFGDIMPSSKEISDFMVEIEPHLDADIVYELVERPLELGSSNWKPGYTFRTAENEKKKYLPGHIGIIQPENCRIDFACELLSLLYNVKNKSVSEKFSYLFQNTPILGVKYPIALIESLPNAFLGLWQFSKRKLSLEDGEKRIAPIFVDEKHRRIHNDKHVYIHTTKIVSLGIDIDTEEELKDLEARIAQKNV